MKLGRLTRFKAFVDLILVGNWDRIYIHTSPHFMDLL
ncbi:MAG: hypothetical protein JWQ34_378 [Mucilaginibacter sp.]|nr:hypothetical protein [Mucilaginibacter sp.]